MIEPQADWPVAQGGAGVPEVVANPVLELAVTEAVPVVWLVIT